MESNRPRSEAAEIRLGDSNTPFTEHYLAACDVFGTVNVTDVTSKSFDFERTDASEGVGKFVVDCKDALRGEIAQKRFEKAGYDVRPRPDRRFNTNRDQSTLVVIWTDEAVPITPVSQSEVGE